MSKEDKVKKALEEMKKYTTQKATEKESKVSEALKNMQTSVNNYNNAITGINRLQSAANYPSYNDQVIALQNKAKEDEQKKLESMTPTQKLLSKFYDTNNVNYADSPNVVTSVIGRQLGQTPTDKGGLLKVPENMLDNNRRFEDGYQFGDITKTLGENFLDSASAIGNTLAEIPTRVTKGVLSVPENIANAGASLIAGGADLIGQGNFANQLRKQVATGSPFKSIDNTLDKINESLNKNSFSGGLLDSATEGIGQTFGQLATSSVLGKLGEIPIKVGKFNMSMPVTALLTGLGSSASETYSRAEQQLNGIQNASWREKVQMALNIAAGGTIEGATEGLFGLMGMGGSSFGDKISGKLMSNAVTSMDKVVMNLLISGGGEAIEEAISYFGNWLWNNGLVNNIGQLDFRQAWNSTDMWNEMLSAFLSSSISQGSTNINQINRLTNNAIQQAEYKQRRNLTDVEKQGIRNQMTNLVIDAKDSLQNSARMYPQARALQDQQTVNANIQANRERLRQKGYLVNEDNTVSGLSRIDQIRLKHGLPARNVQVTTSQNMAQNNVQQQIIQPQNKNQNLVPNNSSIQGLEDYTEQDIKDMVTDHIQERLGDVNIKGISLNGSRLRGDSRNDSDLDVVVEYDGDMTEDGFFNAVNEEPLVIDGITVDINPITKGKSGTLQEYMERSRQYDSQKLNNQPSSDTRLFKDILEQLDSQEIYAEEQKLMAEKYGDEALDMDWGDEIDQDIENRATEIVYNRFVNSDEGKQFIRNYGNDEDSIVFEDREEYNPNESLKSKIELYSELPENKSLYELEYDGYGEDIALGIEKYIEDKFDLKSKKLSVKVDESKKSESKYIRIGDDNTAEDIATIRLSTHSNNEPQGQYDKKIYYNKNDSIEDVQKLIDDAVNDVVNNVDINSKNDYNIVSEPSVPYTDYKNHIFFDDDGIDVGNVEKDLMSAINSRYDGNPPKNVTLCIPWRNDLYLYQIDDNFKLKVTGVIKIEGNENVVDFFEKEFGDDAGKYVKEETEQYDSSPKRNRSGQRFSTSSNIDVEKGKSSRTNERILNKKQKSNNISNTRRSNEIGTNIENSNKGSFSMPKTDSEGNKLTKEQQEYFKNSKVRDENGNLLVMYHGTEANAKIPKEHWFTIFDIDKSGKNGNVLGEGFYFTSNKEHAQQYAHLHGNIYTTYLNITNPLKLKYFNAGDLGYMIRNINPYIEADVYKRNGTLDGYKVRKYLIENGYDGIQVADNYVAFYPEQIKDITNKTPTDNPDILKEENAQYNSDDKTLVATHNLTEEKLKGILELGGFPVPSIAISDVNKLTPTQFGNITVVFDKNTINPSRNTNKVFDRDVWSPTFPTIGYNISNSKIRDMMEQNGIDIDYEDDLMAKAANRFFDASQLKNFVGNDLDTALKDMKRNDLLKYIYAKTKFGLKPTLKNRNFSYYFSNDTLQKFIDYIGDDELDINRLNSSEIEAKYKDKIIELMIEDNAKQDKIQEFDENTQEKYKEMLRKTDSNNSRRLVDFIMDASKMKYYQNQNNLKTVDEEKTLKNAKETINQNDFETWIDTTFGSMFKNTKKGIRNEKDEITDNGRRSWEQLHDEYNLSNVVKSMKKGQIKGRTKKCFWKWFWGYSSNGCKRI